MLLGRGCVSRVSVLLFCPVVVVAFFFVALLRHRFLPVLRSIEVSWNDLNLLAKVSVVETAASLATLLVGWELYLTSENC